MQNFYKKEEGNIIYLINDRNIKNPDIVIDKISRAVNLTGNELIYILGNVVKIVKPYEGERRLLGFSENDISNFLYEVFNIDSSGKYILFQDIVNSVDLLSMSEKEFIDFIGGGYKSYLLNQIAIKLSELAEGYMNGVAIKASANYIFRKNFKKVNLKLGKIIKEVFSSRDFKLLYAMIGFKIQKIIFEDKDKFIKDGFNSFYDNEFLKDVDLIKFSESQIIVYHEHIIKKYKKYLVEYYMDNSELIGFNIDKPLLNGLIDSLLKKQEIIKVYKLLSYKLVHGLNGKNSNIITNYLAYVFSGKNIIKGRYMYKLPSLNISIVSSNDMGIDEMIRFIKRSINLYKIKKKELNDIKENLFTKKKQIDGYKNSICKLSNEINILEKRIKELNLKIKNIKNIINDTIEDNGYNKGIFNYIKNAFKNNNIKKYEGEMQKIRFQIGQLNIQIKDKKSEKLKYQYLIKDIDLDKINSKLENKKKELLDLEKNYNIIVNDLFKNLMKKKVKI